MIKPFFVLKELNLAVEFRMSRNFHQLLYKSAQMSVELRVEVKLNSNEAGESILDDGSVIFLFWTFE